jgi:uncharacterized membrane protein YjdF
VIDTINPKWAINKKKIDIIFIIAIVLLLWLTVISAFISPESVKDCIFAILVMGIFYTVQKRYHVPIIIIIIAILPFFFHLCGVIFLFYEELILGIGYDKIIHFVNAFSGTIVAFYLLIAHSKKMPLLKVFAAILIVVGIGAIVENIEFIGSKYLDMKGPTILSQDSFSASVKNSILKRFTLSEQVQIDMIEQDTPWDMLFNTIGTIAGALVIWMLWHVDKEYLKERTHVHEE